MITLALKYWWAIVIMVLAALLSVQTVRLAGLQSDVAVAAQRRAEQAQIAEQAQRTEETRRQAAIDKEASDAQAKIVQLEADASAARDSAERLRRAVNATVSRARADSKPANPGSGQPSADTLDLLIGVLSRTDDAAGELGLYADRLRTAGLACERAWSGLQSSGREAP